MRSVGRGKDKTYGHTSPHYDSLSSLFAKTVTGPYNQDISFLIVGDKGMGKSHSSLSIAHHTAQKIAKIRGGTWEDYFTLDNVAIIRERDAMELMTKLDKNNVYIYDDIGLGWNARKFSSQKNVDKNDIFQISRVANTVQIFSVPNQFLLDKVPRSLVTHYGEMYQKLFEFGYTSLKMFEPIKAFRQGKVLNPYPVRNRQKYVLYVVPAPPEDLAKEYDKLRAKIMREIAKEKAEEGNGGEQQKPKAGQMVSCSRCGYTWFYKGRKDTATCPSCRKNVPASGLETTTNAATCHI